MLRGLVQRDGGTWKQPCFVRLVVCRFLFYEQVVRHVLARHDPLRCAESAKRGQRREGHDDDQRAVRFRGNELLGLVTVGGVEVRLVTMKAVSKQRKTSRRCQLLQPR